ncbi:MAG TPA: amidohydrolase [Actinobacteria bacterium]|nr:amidohydrolase [Actinomycetota bacterium]
MTRRADRVFYNGRVFRADAARSWAESIALGAGRILAVGGWSEVAPLIGPDTEVVDLDGRFLGPGFQDAHIHPHTGGRRMLSCDLTDCGDAASALEVIAAYAAAHSEAPWIHGGGWQFSWFDGGMPAATLLDRVVADRPVYLRVADGHAAWANSAALAAAGIDAGHPEPRFGRIERLPDGSPQGTLQEEGGMALVERLLPQESPDDFDAALLAAQRHLFSLGVTAWQDAAVGEQLHHAYRRLADDGRLRATVRGALWWEPEQGREQLDLLVARSGEAVGRYSAGSVKLMLDGVCENFTARTLTPYLDAAGAPTANYGMDYLDPESLPGIVSEVMRRGLQPHFHALGDAAVRRALDAVEVARRDLGWDDLRPHIAHLQIVHPDDLPRFRRLGVIANAQALWACADTAMLDLTVPFIGEPRASWQYPFGALLRAGATLAMGSDWSVTSADPLAQIEVAVRRLVPGDPASVPFLPEQRITVADAFTAFTAGSAYVNHRERESGSLHAGATGDLVILDGDPFVAADLSTLVVEETIVAGETVYRR